MNPPTTAPDQVRLVVFDWDGTLMDSTAAIVEAIQGAAADLALPVPDARRASHVIGLGLHDALRHAVPDLAADRLPDFVDRYRHHYLRRDAGLRLFDGVREMLAALRAHPSVMVAVATGKSRVGLERAFDSTGLRPMFVASRCADEGLPKPDPWMLVDLCETLGVDASATVMVGDTTHDLGMARAAGAHGLGVAWGAHPRDVLEGFGPLALFDDVPALDAWLRAHLP